MTTDLPIKFETGNLVLFKSRPARVTGCAAKIEIELPDGKKVSVRDKDISLLHPGPFQNFLELEKIDGGEIEEACEILVGENTTLPELSELIYGAYTPQSVWAVCKLMLDGLYFFGTPSAISVRSKTEYEKEAQRRVEKTAQKDAWQDFIQRLRNNKKIDEDKERIGQLENFCLGKVPTCRILKDLGIQETQAHAHELLLKLGFWDNTKNPYPARLGFPENIMYPDLESLPHEDRLDLTHLEAFAIDDEGNKDPDDAVSIDGATLWIHVADVAAVVKPGSTADTFAMGLAANLYLPESTTSMLPSGAVDLFGLGIHEISPALSFGITLAENGSIDTFHICPSLVKVTRMTYSQAQEKAETSPLKQIFEFTHRYRAFRKARNAVFISFPEVRIRVNNGLVSISLLPELDARDMVTDAMLMAGEAAARFAADHALPFPFTTQPPPDTVENPADLAAMFCYRRQLKPSVVKTSPDSHAGLGLESYSRVTSPLRRYLDLVAHQQIRASLSGGTVLDEQVIMERIGASAAMTGTIQKIERQSNLHWTLVFLMQNPGWQGKGIVVEIRERYSIILIPQIAFETRISANRALSLNEEILLRVISVDLPGQIAHFAVEKY